MRPFHGRPNGMPLDVPLARRHWPAVQVQPVPLVVAAFVVAMRSTELQLIAFVQWFRRTGGR